MNRKVRQKLIPFCILPTLALLSSQTIASDFNRPFVNASELGNVYAGWAAATTDDASTEFTNPAGLVRITNQQLVIAAVGLVGHTQFEGTVTPPFPPLTGTASTDSQVLLPSFYYAAPISDSVVFAFGYTIPFAVGADYSKDSLIRYDTTRSSIVAMDLGPGIGVKITDKLSAGLGLDAERLTMTFDNMYGPPISVPDSESQNHVAGWGYGWHGGLLYQFTPRTRVGFDYNSHIVFNPTGDSEIYAPPMLGGTFRTTNLRSNITLPSRAQFSAYHELTKRWAVMGSVFYTNWGTLNQLTLRNTLIPGGMPLSVTAPLNYHNTFDYALGVNFKATNKWLFRTGVHFLQTPTNNRNRIIQDPVGDATIVGVGVHYQQNHSIGYDVSYAHPFFQQTAINHFAPLNTEVGHCHNYSNIFGAQITWNIT